MHIKLIYSIVELLFVTTASASFSSDNDKIGIRLIMSNDLTKDMSVKIDPFLAAEMRGRLLLQIPLLSELLKTQEKPILIASGKVSW